MLSTLLGIPLSLLPAFYRKRWFSHNSINFDRGAHLSGLIQAAGCGWLFFHGYLQFLALGGSVPRGLNAMYGVGFVSMLDYLMHPTPLVLAYFALEGMVRFAVALVASDRMGTLPLALIAQIQRGLAFAASEFRLGRRVPDEVQHGDGGQYDLLIASCRPKNWTSMTTISYQDVFYEVTDQRNSAPPRRFVYLLRQKPAVKIIRGLHVYSPDEALRDWKRNRLRKKADRGKVMAARAG